MGHLNNRLSLQDQPQAIDKLVDSMRGNRVRPTRCYCSGKTYYGKYY